MIEGLKVTVIGTELRELCLSQADNHEKRRVTYRDQVQSMRSNQIEGMKYTNGDPIQVLLDRQSTHEMEQSELRFIAAHLEPSEKYILGAADLQKLGITKSRY